MAKKGVHLYLTAELFERAKAACDRLPDTSLSSVVEDLLEVMTPQLEAMVNAIEGENPHHARRLMADAWADMIMAIAFGEEDETG